MAVLAALRTTGNITGNTYAVGTAALSNLQPTIFAGYVTITGQTATFRDGLNGPVVWYANATAQPYDEQIFAHPIYCANGVYVNTQAAANTVILYA